MLRQVALIDCETEGFEKTARPIEIAIAIFDIDARTIVSAESHLIRHDNMKLPGIDLPGLTLDLLDRQGITMSAFRTRMVQVLLGPDPASRVMAFVAHNADYDRRFWSQLDIPLDIPWICTVKDVDWPGHGSRKLVDLAQDFEIVSLPAHRALGDVMTLANLLSMAEGPDLRDILDAPDRTILVRARYERKSRDSRKPRDFGFLAHPEYGFCKRMTRGQFMTLAPGAFENYGFEIEEVR